jgi:HEAT repeat protein
LLAVGGIVAWFLIQRLRPQGVEKLKGADLSALSRALSDRDPAVRSKAAAMLGKLGPKAKSTVPLLNKTLSDEDPDVSLSGALAIVKIDPSSESSDSSSAVPVLAGALLSADFGIRREAAEGLGKFGARARDAVPALCAALKDPNNIIRRLAADSLGRIGQDAGDAAVPLTEALEDKDERVREAARRALDKIAIN